MEADKRAGARRSELLCLASFAPARSSLVLRRPLTLLSPFRTTAIEVEDYGTAQLIKEDIDKIRWAAVPLPPTVIPSGVGLETRERERDCLSTHRGPSSSMPPPLRSPL